MAINTNNTNTVPPSSVAPIVLAREPALALNAQREQTLATPPSAITRISSEGRLRAEFERKQIVPLEQENVTPAPQPAQNANQTPPNNTISVAAARPERPERNEVLSQVATDAAPPRPTPPPRTGNSADVELPVIVPQRPIPFDTPLGLLATRVSSAPAARLLSVSTAVENIANTNPPASDDRVTTTNISQAANEFAAAFSAFQNRRNQALENAVTVSQAQAANVAELRISRERNVPPTFENVTRPAAPVGIVRFDISTFAVGVARNVAAQNIDQRTALTALSSQDNPNDTQRIAQAEVAGLSNRAVVSRAEVVPEVANLSQIRSSASIPSPQSAAQNSAASDLDGTGVGQGGIAKHLNALANLLTP